MLGRRSFIRIGAAAVGEAVFIGCRGLRREDDAIAVALRKAVDSGLYAGLVCGSNRRRPEVCGRRTIYGPRLPVELDTRFDLASVGKTHTAALCALLFAEGRLDLDAPFTEYLPEHVLAKENCGITLRDLATHTGGFDNSKPYMTADWNRYFGGLMAKRPVWKRGERFCYACSNFVYLGMIVERLTGLDLDSAAKRMLWGPLGMTRTTWGTCTDDPNVAECPEETYGGGRRRRIGERNDTCAHLAGRPMGNGADFSTGPDMLRFVTDLLDRRTFRKEYYELLFTASAQVDGHRRSFGWDMTAPKSTFSDWGPTGFSDRAICHTGWTGSAIAVDPECGFAGVVLGNRLASKKATMGPRMHLLELMRGDIC